MRSRNLLFALALGIAASSTGCTVHGRASMHTSGSAVVYQEPPPPQVETVTVRPGYVWVRGRWDWRDGRWQWIGGRWEVERRGYQWSEGRWELQGNYYVWVEGRWDAAGRSGPPAGGGVQTRDHRR